MKVSYTGRHEAFPPRPRATFEAKLQKLSKMIDRRGEREAHVILAHERFLHKVEITINAWDHALVGNGYQRGPGDRSQRRTRKGRETDSQTAQQVARYEALQGQSAANVGRAGSVRPRRGPKKSSAAAARKSTARNNSGRKKIFRVNHNDGSKPMTVEEAMLEMEQSQDYMVYRDAQTDRVTVLMRRPDGNFDLIES